MSKQQKEARPRYHSAKPVLAAAAFVALSAVALYSFSLAVFVSRFGVVPW